MTIKVLVVEDDHLLRAMAVEALSDEGFDVLEAATGREALERCREHAMDVLFTDIRLPGDMTGWDIAEHCRQTDPDLPVVYATGFSHIAARPVPGSLWFQKPYRPQQIVQAIRDLTAKTDIGTSASRAG